MQAARRATRWSGRRPVAGAAARSTACWISRALKRRARCWGQYTSSGPASPRPASSTLKRRLCFRRMPPPRPRRGRHEGAPPMRRPSATSRSRRKSPYRGARPPGTTTSRPSRRALPPTWHTQHQQGAAPRRRATRRSPRSWRGSRSDRWRPSAQRQSPVPLLLTQLMHRARCAG